MKKKAPPQRDRKPEDGRPSKLELNPEIQQRVCDALMALCKHSTAAALAGISLRTFYQWRGDGAKDPHGPYGDFSRAVVAAEAHAQEGLSLSATAAARKDGRLALDLLRARWPHVWPKETTKLKISGNFGVTDADLISRLDRLAAGRRASGGSSGTDGGDTEGS